MSLRVTILSLLCLAASVPGRCQRDPRTIVALVQDYGITEGEFDQALGDRLIKIRTEEYDLKRSALNGYIQVEQIRREASMRGLSVADLIRVEVSDKVLAVTSIEANAIYESRKAEYRAIAREDALRLASERLKAQRTSERRAEYLAELWKRFEPQILLDPPRATSNLAVGPAKGPDQAPITIVEFTDFQCPFCAKVQPVLKQLDAMYPGKIRFAFRSLPISSHAFAEPAAEAALCAGEQGRFWDMHDHLFERQDALTTQDLARYAHTIGLDQALFDSCRASDRPAKASREDQAAAAGMGINSTPTFFINGRLLTGAADYSTLSELVEEELDRRTRKKLLDATAPPPR